ncbi:acetylglutamate kinase [Herbivorax sp. ANBcel31]|uniref:acetylglutamate kinase n=1 Tax=Herbivorax sp. ANBcel31 TaxID=3069754 RepID=UPI0027B82506|nr:acetylglutamate kinase [Herbivorax sp. ANBcel31]MDQ2085408.1 acetylglutamate kinase [Herbivorax sp. ANBcel31]
MKVSMETIIKKAEILIEALPYIQKLFGKTVVIKYGGNAMINEELKNSVIEDITLLKYIGMNPVVIHGGGPDITNALNKFNIKSEFINGLRVTDKETMETAQMVLVGKTNKEIVSLLNQMGGKAIGLSGIDGKLIECEKYKTSVKGEEVDLGYVGKIKKINSKLIELVAKDEYIPIVAPIGVGENGESYNINADTVAGEIAASLKAEKLMLLTDVEGVKTKDDKIVPALTAKEAHELIDKDVINGGMIPKVLGCIDALEKGVGRTHIVDGRIPHCLLLEIFTNKGIGTMIMKEKNLYFENEKL